MVNSKSKFIESLFKNLNDKQVDYFVIGEYQNLPESNGNSDLDIIVSPNCVGDLLSVLNRLLLQYNIKVVSYYSNSNAKFYRLLCDHNTNWGLQLDLFCKGLFFQTKEYYPLSELENDLLVYNGIKVLNLKKTYFIGFLKEIIHKGWAKDKYIDGFVSEVLSHEIKYRELLTRLYGRKFTKIVFDNLTPNQLKPHTKILGSIMLKKVYYGNFTWLYKNIERVKYLKRVLCQPGYSIVFLGEHSHRKIAIINDVASILNESFHNSVYRENRYNFITPINKTHKKDSNIKGLVDYIEAPNVLITIKTLSSFFYYLFDFTKRYWIKISLKKTFHSCVWLFNSYHYDYYIFQKKDRSILKKYILKIQDLIIPDPDIIICLDTNSDLVSREVSEISKFCINNPKAIRINTECSLEQSVDSTMRGISGVMVKRFEIFNKFD